MVLDFLSPKTWRLEIGRDKLNARMGSTFRIFLAALKIVGTCLEPHAQQYPFGGIYRQHGSMVAEDKQKGSPKP